MSDVKLIIGLGNPGLKYKKTRHNAGFWVIDSLAKELGIKVKKKKFGAVLGEGMLKDKKLILAKPWLYMNRSGQAVATIVGFYKLDPEDIVVIYDDIALDTGRLRIRKKGSSGGHNGLKDIISKLNTKEFARVRIGIGQNERMPAEAYVLSKPESEERKILDEAVANAKKAVFKWLKEGVEAAMNEFNSAAENNKEND